MNSNHQAFRGQKAKHLELKKRLYNYVDDKKKYRFAVTSEMCQLKALSITKELGITGFKVSQGWIFLTAMSSTMYVQIDAFLQANLYFSYF